MCVVHIFLEFAIFIIEFNAAISESDGDEITDSLGEWDPVVIPCIGVQLHELGALVGVHIPFIDDIIFAETALTIEIPGDFVGGAPRNRGADFLVLLLCF